MHLDEHGLRLDALATLALSKPKVTVPGPHAVAGGGRGGCCNQKNYPERQGMVVDRSFILAIIHKQSNSIICTALVHDPGPEHTVYVRDDGTITDGLH